LDYNELGIEGPLIEWKELQGSNIKYGRATELGIVDGHKYIRDDLK
jgi:hypothetical protein